MILLSKTHTNKHQDISRLISTIDIVWYVNLHAIANSEKYNIYIVINISWNLFVNKMKHIINSQIIFDGTFS